MANDEIFESAIRPNGDLAGVYEYDGETGYFYLYKTGSGENKVLAAIHIFSGPSDFIADDIEILWDRKNEKVGLFIHQKLWAVFDAMQGASYGGDYQIGATPQLPSQIVSGFKQKKH